MPRFVFPLLCGIVIVACNATPTSTSAPINRDGSSLRVIVQPEAGNAPILDALNSAQKSIRVVIYLLTEREVIDALKAARGRGVDVRVLIEDEPYGSGPGNKQAISDLQAANVSVKTGNPVFRLTHQKAIVIDDRMAFIMTFNLTHSAVTMNREYGIISTKPDDVAEIISVFEADWNRRVPTMSNPNLVWSPVNARQRMIDLINGAKQTLDVEHAEMQDDQIIARLIDAAQRGVAVRVVMSPQTGSGDPDKAGQGKLVRNGIAVRLVKTPFVHAKMMIADNARALVSSQNISTSSLDFNRELGILVTDPKIIQTLSATFATDWNVGK